MSEHVAIKIGHRLASDVPDSSEGLTSAKDRKKALRLPSSESAVKLTFNGEQKLSSPTALAAEEDMATAVAVEEGMVLTDWTKNSSPSLPYAECRICQEEDQISNLEAPCACSGSLKFAHRKCVQHWCNEKGDTVCEICRKSYEGSYTAPHSFQDNISINIGGNWNISSSRQFDMHERRLLGVSSEPQFLEADYDEYAGANARSAACFRSVALLLMVLLLLRHILSMTVSGTDEEASTFFMLFVLRAAGFLLPCYIMARAINVLQCRRQREEAALAAAEMAYLFQAGQGRGVRLAVSPGMPSN